jgi:hypothetical protein
MLYTPPESDAPPSRALMIASDVLPPKKSLLLHKVTNLGFYPSSLLLTPIFNFSVMKLRQTF